VLQQGLFEALDLLVAPVKLENCLEPVSCLWRVRRLFWSCTWRENTQCIIWCKLFEDLVRISKLLQIL